MSQSKPIRSPSYPSTALGDAIEQVRKIEEQYRTSAVHRESAAKLIGYTSLSGPANKALAALAAYGLVERAGKGEMRVTTLAQDILYGSTPEERFQGLASAALNPALFRELQERWPNMIPPEDGVVMYLNRQGFNQSAVRPAARAYLDTLAYLKELDASESHGIAPNQSPESPGDENNSDDNYMTTTTAPRPSAAATPAVVATGELNRISMNIQGDKVHLSGLLDLAGLASLEKKIVALKTLLEGAGGEPVSSDG